MPRVSQKTINKETNLEIRENFSFLISSLQNPNDIEQFFADFLTHEENLMLAKRLMLHLLLNNQYKSLEIQSILGISKETVRTHANNWEKGGETYKKIINKISGRRKVKLFMQAVEKKMRPLELALKSKSNMKARAKLLNGDY